jgi:hypothetical protein
MATSTIFELNFQRLYEINITPETTATYARVAKGIKSADPSTNEDTDNSAYLDGGGFKSTDVIAKQFSIAFSGSRVKGDSAQDFIFAKILAVGDDLKTQFKRTDAFGNQITGDVTIKGIDDGGGDAGSKVDIGFTVDYNGAPTFTPATPAAALTATVAASSATSGCTKFTATAGSGNHLGYKLKAATLGTINGKSFVSGYVSYTSAGDIPAVAGQYLCMFEIDANERVVAYKEVALASGDIKA